MSKSFSKSMAEKARQFIGYGNTGDDEQLRKKRRAKCIVYLILLGAVKAGITVLFALTILRFRTPKFRIHAATVDALDYTIADANPSFTTRMRAELTLKNANFVKYKFPSSSVSFYYNGEAVGSAFVSDSRARLRSTKKWSVVVDLSSAGVVNRSKLANDLRSGVLRLNSRSTLSGKIELLRVLKKHKSAEMDCVIVINLAGKSVGDLRCK